MMYAEFVTKEAKKKDNEMKEVNEFGSSSKTRSRNTPLRWIIGTSTTFLALVGIAITLYFVLPLTNGPDNTNPLSPASPSDPQTPTPNTFFPSPDQAVLVEFYRATQGRGWRAKASPDMSVCEWGGIICDGNSRVFEIDLDSQNLYGTIPNSIGTVKNLRTLRLGMNALKGTIPASIANLTTLTELTLSYGQYEGTFPEEIFSLTFLEKINIAQIPGLSWTIPPTIKKLRMLNTLIADDTGLYGTIPNEISQLKRLQSLSLSRNNLTGTVPTLVNSQLSSLCLEYNHLTGTIPELPTLDSSFSEIRLQGNNFTGTVEHLAHLEMFTKEPVINLSKNNLSGEFYLPVRLFERNLGYLNISSNQFTTLSPLWENITMRTDCDASNNPFRCPLPEWFKNTCKATCT